MKRKKKTKTAILIGIIGIICIAAVLVLINSSDKSVHFLGVWVGNVAGYENTTMILVGPDFWRGEIRFENKSIEPLTNVIVTRSSFSAIRPADNNASIVGKISYENGNYIIKGQYIESGESRGIYLTKNIGISETEARGSADSSHQVSKISLSSCGFTDWVEGNEYYLANDITAPLGKCFLINKNNILLDCNGKSIVRQEADSEPLSDDGTLNLVKNNVAVYIKNAKNVTVINCRMKYAPKTHMLNYGFYTESSENVKIFNSEVSNSAYGITLYNTSNSILRNLTFKNNVLRGIKLYEGSYDVFENIMIINSSIGIEGAISLFIDYYAHNSTFNNIVIKNSDMPILSELGSLNITNSIITDNKQGIAIYGDNNFMENNTICNNNEDDIFFNSQGSSGLNNKCSYSKGFNDTGKTGCTFSC